MAVTAEVWEETHEYHRQQQQFHALLNHGVGIVSGLEVIASDPPDSSVYVQPGIAIDPSGRSIVMPQGLSFDLGAVEGPIYLILSYGESRPRAGGGYNGNEDILYVHSEYSIEARATLPTRSHIELARLRKENRAAPILDAKNSAQPKVNEIDLRFRREIGIKATEIVTLGVVHLGGKKHPKHGQGASYLARALRASESNRVWVDDDVTLTASNLSSYTLLYLVGRDSFQLKQEETDVLSGFLREGGSLFMESCHQEGEGTPAADRSFTELASSLGVKLEDLPAGHALLTDPHLFAVPPTGYESKGSHKVRVGGGVVLSTHDYGCLWQAEQRSGPPSREQIRAALEWGSNIVAYAMARRQKARTEQRLAATGQELLMIQ
ncbi:MAG: DUF4159 domain-containing protein [Ardenticatenales bacterium]|nr:DUF4159 domain-containing protein [Ardenticatenales bacterium]